MVETLVVDLAAADAGERVARAAEALGPTLDVLVSNAGIAPGALLEQLDTAVYDETFAVNTRATWLLAKALHPLLRADGGGAVVATASIAAEEPSAPIGAYSASKAALVMLVRQMAYEWGPDGIRCNCVSPGMTHTGLTDGTYSDPARKAERAAHVPLRRIAEPEDVANVIAFLAGPDAAYVTGVNLVVDGGVQTVVAADDPRARRRLSHRVGHHPVEEEPTGSPSTSPGGVAPQPLRSRTTFAVTRVVPVAAHG